MRRHHKATSAAALSALLLTTGCGGGPVGGGPGGGGVQGEGRASPGTPAPSGSDSGGRLGSYDPPGRFAQEPALTVSGTDGLGKLGQRAFYATGSQGVTAFDLETMERRWTVPTENQQNGKTTTAPALTLLHPKDDEAHGPKGEDAGGELVVAAFGVTEEGEGSTSDAERVEVVAVSGESGTVRWRRSFTPRGEKMTWSQSFLEQQGLQLHTADADTVVLQHDGTRALNAENGELRWSDGDFTTRGASDGVLLGYPAHPDRGEVRTTGVTARSAAHGREKWRHGSTGAGTRVREVWSDRALLDTSDEKETYLLDLGSGAEIRRWDTKWEKCEYDERSVTVCTTGGSISALDADSGAPLWTLPSRPGTDPTDESPPNKPSGGDPSPGAESDGTRSDGAEKPPSSPSDQESQHQPDDHEKPAVYAVWHGSVYARSVSAHGAEPFVLNARTGRAAKPAAEGAKGATGESSSESPARGDADVGIAPAAVNASVGLVQDRANGTVRIHRATG